jgi:hypothetical protein
MSFVLRLSVQAQSQSSSADAAGQAKTDKISPQKEAPGPAPRSVKANDAEVRAFLRRIAGRWAFDSYRKGNTSWWRDHESSRPRNAIHYLFGPHELLIESRPEFEKPSITDRFAYRVVGKVSADLFDVELYKPSEPASAQIKRFKLAPGGKTLLIVSEADTDPEPTVQVLNLIDTRRSAGANPR